MHMLIKERKTTEEVPWPPPGAQPEQSSVNILPHPSNYSPNTNLKRSGLVQPSSF